MKHTLLVAALTLPLGVYCLVNVARSADPDPERIPWEPKGDATYVGYWGAVTELTKDAITIQLPNKKVKPKTFPVSETLAAGKSPMEPRVIPGLRVYRVSPSSMYRLTDVKVGDVVLIHYARLGGTDICDHISIVKRPGGLVPPLPAEAEELMKPSPSPPWAKDPLRARYIPYHEQMNAYWDLEDRGIPYPEKFREHRRWPVAPAPREAKPRP